MMDSSNLILAIDQYLISWPSAEAWTAESSSQHRGGGAAAGSGASPAPGGTGDT
jgi:hypothetical protein